MTITKAHLIANIFYLTSMIFSMTALILWLLILIGMLAWIPFIFYDILCMCNAFLLVKSADRIDDAPETTI